MLHSDMAHANNTKKHFNSRMRSLMTVDERLPIAIQDKSVGGNAKGSLYLMQVLLFIRTAYDLTDVSRDGN